MVEKKQVSHAEFQIIYADTPPSISWSITPHTLNVGCLKCLPSKENRKGKKEYIPNGEAWQTHTASDSGQDPQWQWGHLDSVRWGQHVISGVSLPKVQKPSVVMSNTADQSLMRVILQDAWPVLPQTFQVIKNKGSWRCGHHHEEPKGDMTTRCPAVSWRGSWCSKKTSGEIWEVWMRHGLQLMMMYQSILVH